MLPFLESFLAWSGATAVPALLGLVLITVIGRWVNPKYLVAFAVGIFFWFFVDTIQGSANLDVGAGFGGGVEQTAMVLLFVTGVLAFFYLDKEAFSLDPRLASLSIAVPMLAALAVGIHGFGEGTAFGSTAALTSSTSLLGPNGAFGGLNPSLAYALHKALEPMIAGSLYAVYSNGRAEKPSVWLRNILALTTLFALPSIIGAATGYFINYDATYFFALGTGTSIYALIRMTKCLYRPEDTPGSQDSLKISLALVAGFILIYLAALLHS